MSRHRNDTSIAELKTYFNSVIDWISATFIDVKKEMRGLKWGELYERFHEQPYNPQAVSKKLKELYSDFYVTNKKGIFEYILGGCIDTSLLHIRFFDESVKRK